MNLKLEIQKIKNKLELKRKREQKETQALKSKPQQKETHALKNKEEHKKAQTLKSKREQKETQKLRDKQKSEFKNFYWLATGQFVSQFGSKMTSCGLVLWAYKESGLVLSTSLLSVCYLVPEVLLSFIAGSISDSWSKKKIMLIADSIAAVFSVIVIALLFTQNLRLEYLYVINFILGVTDAFQNPASTVAESLIVSRENYMKTSGLRSFFGSFTVIFATTIAASLYAFCGLKFIIIIDLLTFCFSFITLAFFVNIPKVTVTVSETESLYIKCRAGLHYIFRRKDICSLIMFMAFVNFIAAIYNTLLSPLVLSRSMNNNLQLGIVSGAVGVAGLFGSIIVSRIPQVDKKIPLIINVMTFSFITGNGLLGIGRNYYVWTVAVFLGNLLIPILIANVEYIMRTKIPITMQGRVFSARNTLQYTSIPLGNLTAGYLADQVFEPFMKQASPVQRFLLGIVGRGSGNGIAFLYLCIAIAGIVGCIAFRRMKSMRELDENQEYIE